MAQAMRDAGFQSVSKEDGTLVTPADPAVERFFRERLPALTPGAAIWGEELGYETMREEGLWALDPIDGTGNYAYGSPIWGISAAYLGPEGVRLGAIFLPDLGEMYLARRGERPTCNGRPLEPIPAGKVHDKQLVSYSDSLLRRYPDTVWPGNMRCAWAFVVDATFVARQRFRGLIGHREMLYDVAAALLICQELGAEIRYCDGSPMPLADLLAGGRIARPWMIFPAGNEFVWTTP